MAEIICFDKGGREARRALVERGEAPSDFFYGTDLLQREGFDIANVNTVVSYRGLLGGMHRLRERIAGRLFGQAYRTHLLELMEKEMAAARVALSFTDGFSLTLGNYYRGRTANAPCLIGCFHGLSDIEFKVPRRARGYVEKKVAAALGRLDRIAFFGPADRDFAIERYAIPARKTAIIRFGVDMNFWSPRSGMAANHVFSIGQDHNRDFDTLAQAETDMPVRIHTCLNVNIPHHRRNITLSSGSYFNSTLTDIEVRDFYRNALAVVVPLKDVFQPTGYSVTLQAMSCGRPVILSRIKGLWAPELLVDGENCLLVEPGNPGQLAEAIEKLRADKGLRDKLGAAARNTVKNHFQLKDAADSVRNLLATCDNSFCNRRLN